MTRKAYALLSQFICPVCGKGFEQKSKMQRHTESAHPPNAPSSADIENVRKDNYSRKERIVSVLRRISDKKYQNLVEVTKEIGKVK